MSPTVTSAIAPVPECGCEGAWLSHRSIAELTETIPVLHFFLSENPFPSNICNKREEILLQLPFHADFSNYRQGISKNCFKDFFTRTQWSRHVNPLKVIQTA